MSAIDEARALIAAGRWREAAALLRPLTDVGDRDIDYLFGSLLFEAAEDCVTPTEALAALHRAAALDHPAACYRVATTTIDSGVVTGPVVDRDLLIRAASLADVDDLAFMLLYGEGGPVDRLAGLRWLERAARQGDVGSRDAARLLADTFEHGWFEATADPAAARYWRNRECELEGRDGTPLLP